MGEKNKVVVRIGSNEYTLTGEESPDYIQRVAALVDKKTQEIIRADSSLSIAQTAVLASINMGDDVLKQHHFSESNLRKIRELEKRLEASAGESDALRQEISAARNSLVRIKQELVRSEAENRDLREQLKRAKNGGDVHG
jgi:cell division protein ZapA